MKLKLFSSLLLFFASWQMQSFEKQTAWSFSDFQAIENQTFPNIGIVGTITGWGTNPDIAMSTTDGVNYSASNILFPAGGGLVKFRQDSSWNVNWGSNQFPSGTATSGGADIPVPAGSYDVTFNIQTGAYNFTLLPSVFPVIGMIGEFNNWATSVDMFTTDGVVYVLNNFFIPAPSNDPGLKFRQDNAWAINWGGSTFPSGTAVLGGQTNIPATAGFYNITFSLTTLAYSFEPILLAIIGTADVDFNTDTVMQTTDGVFHTLNGIDLVDGDLKFRTLGSWNTNWGASDFPSGIGNLNGANIPVVAGNYDIAFNRITGAYSFTLNCPIVALPVAANTVLFANGQTLTSITVQGTNLTWYDAAVGGNVIPSSTLLVDGVTYYVSQTVNGCESERAAVEAIESFIAPSALRPAYCGATFPSLNSALFAVTVSGSSMYEFEVTNTVTNTVELISTTNRFFRISDLADGGSLNTVYDVRVRVVNGGQTGPFGGVCSVTIVPQPIQLRDVSCGANLGSVSSLIYGESFAGAEQYEFEVTNMTTNQVSFVVSTSRNFALTEMTDQTPTLFTEYQVRMRAWIGGAPVVAFGPTCSVFTPENLTQLRPSSCGAQLPNRFTPIFANSVPNATSYEFEVTDTETNEVESIVRDVRNFHLGLLEMEIAFNRVYAIRVRVVVDDQQMNYGTVCTVTTPMDPDAVSRGNAMLDNSFKTYPNPFTTQTTVSWTKTASTQANISVYDVTGKLIQTLTTNESSIQLGQDYTAGMYFVTIVDGEQQFQTKIVKQ